MPFDESAYQRKPCFTDIPLIRLSQEQYKKVDITIRDEQGQPVDLTQFIEDTVGGSSSLAPLEVKLAASHTFAEDNVAFTIDGEIIDVSTGQVRFIFDQTNTKVPGIFVLSIGVFYQGILRYQQIFYLEITPTNFAAGGGPLTIPEVRMDLMDTCPEANYLLDELEFTDAEIIHAMRKAVDAFNELPPPIGVFTYDTFPYRYNWLKGTVGFLLQMVAHRYRRNKLTYSASGITVADQEKFVEYERMGKLLEQEYMDWAQRTKVSLNIRLGYQSIGPSPYGYGRFRRGYF